jgi:hypothetical protein
MEEEEGEDPDEQDSHESVRVKEQGILLPVPLFGVGIEFRKLLS